MPKCGMHRQADTMSKTASGLRQIKNDFNGETEKLKTEICKSVMTNKKTKFGNPIRKPYINGFGKD